MSTTSNEKIFVPLQSEIRKQYIIFKVKYEKQRKNLIVDSFGKFHHTVFMWQKATACDAQCNLQNRKNRKAGHYS